MDILTLPKIKEPKIKVQIERTFAYWFAEHLLNQLKYNPRLMSVIAELYNLLADRINQSTKQKIKLSFKRHQADIVVVILSSVNISDPYYATVQNELLQDIHQKLLSNEIPVIER